MFELVSARCPACGATLKVDSRQPMAQCEYCGQRSMLRRPGVPARPPPPMPNAMAGSPPMTVIELPNMRRRVILILLLTLLPLIFVSVLVFVIISQVRERIDHVTDAFSVPVPVPSSSVDHTADDDDDDAPPLPVIADYLATPQDIAERVRRGVADPPVVRSLSIERASVEVYPADGQRYSITFKGQALRRGGARTVPEPTFDLRTIDLSVLPGLLESVKQTHGASPTKAILEAEDGTPRWQLLVRKDGKGQTLRFEIDGTPVED